MNTDFNFIKSCPDYYEGRTFNVVTYGPPNRISVRNTMNLRRLHDNRYEFLSSPSKVIESSVGSITYTGHITSTVHKITTEKALKIVFKLKVKLV